MLDSRDFYYLFRLSNRPDFAWKSRIPTDTPSGWGKSRFYICFQEQEAQKLFSWNSNSADILWRFG